VLHSTHRLMAFVTLALLAALVMYLRREPTLHKQSRDLAGLLLLQLATGMSNVVLDWPLVAAVLHTGGAGAMVVVPVWALVSTRSHPVSAVALGRGGEWG